MKKIVSVLLMASLVAGSSLALPQTDGTPGTVKAADHVNTYIPRSIVWYNSKAAVYVKEIKNKELTGLYFKAKGGKEVMLTSFDKKYDTSFYLRGDTVYYTLDDTLYSIKTDGSSSKTLEKGVTLLGGYGSRVIYFYNSKARRVGYCINSSGKRRRIIKLADGDISLRSSIMLFDGKAYSPNMIYGIAPISQMDNSISYASGVANKNYVYFSDDDSYGIKRVDRSGNVRTFKDGELLGINETNTLVYLDKNKDICRATGKKKAVKVLTHKQIVNLFGDNAEEVNVRVRDACTVGDKLVFVASYYEYNEKTETEYETFVVGQTGKNGGKVKVLDRARKNNGSAVYDIEAYGNTVFTSIAESKDKTIKQINIK